jgi:hypothetical protein
MNRDVVRLIALNEILGVFFRGVMDIALETYVGNYFLYDDAANSTCFRVPFDMIGTFERLGHFFQSLPNGRCIPQSNGQEKGAVSHAFDIMRNIVF